MTHQPHTEIRQHPDGEFTLAVPVKNTATARVYVGRFKTADAAAARLDQVHRQFALCLSHDPKIIIAVRTMNAKPTQLALFRPRRKKWTRSTGPDCR